MTSTNKRSTAPTGATTDVGPYTIVPAWVADRLRGNALLVYVHLGLHADRHGSAWPGHARLAEATGLGQSTIRAILKELEAQGIVTIEARQRANGSQTSNLYVLALVEPREMGVLASQHPAASQQGGVPASQQGIPLNQSQEEPLAPVPDAVEIDVPVTRKPNLLWDAVVAECKIDVGSLTVTGKANVGKTVRELKEVNATPEDVAVRAKRFRTRYPRSTLTHNTLRNRWAELAPPTPPPSAARTTPRLDLT